MSSGQEANTQGNSSSQDQRSQAPSNLSNRRDGGGAGNRRPAKRNNGPRGGPSRQDGGRPPSRQEASGSRPDVGADQQSNANDPKGGRRKTDSESGANNAAVNGAGGGGGKYPRRNQNNNRRPFAKNRKDHAGIPMTGLITDCLICCQRSDLYAIGDCLHPMCMECGIRTRILGKSNFCPQCRAEVGTLYFVEARREYSTSIATVICEEEAKFGVKFESDYVLDCFRSYLAHKCRICCNRENSPDAFTFPNFAALQQHMTQVHQLTFCYLCSENLNTLSKDRQTYTRNQLQQHITGTNSREDGFRGHPKCLFCEQRFYDEEQQYRHLRKDHFFCQICDADAAKNFFYKTHNSLIKHYKEKHHPCNHPDCLPLGIVYRTVVELNVHRAKQHTVGGRMQINFNYNTGNNGAGPSSSSGNEPPPPAPIFTIVPSAQTTQTPVRIVPSASMNRAADFPLLEQYQQLQPPYGAPPNWRQSQQVKAINNARSAPRLPLQSGEQFPGLPGASKVVQSNAPSSSGASSSSVAQTNSVWSKGSTRQLFKPAPPKSTAQQSKPAGSEQRKKVIPVPDVFPEGMREVIRARQLGLPEPAPEPPELSHADRFEEVKRQEKAQKKKEKKAKRVSASVVAQKVAAAEYVPQSSTRFGTLAVDSSDDENDEFGRPKNWWSSSSKMQAPILQETTDDFVRIDVGKQLTHRRARPAEEESTKVPVSLSDIAANLCSDSEEKKANKQAEEKKAEPAKASISNEDEIELLRHQRQAHYDNDYNLNNEDLDLQMALEMSLLSSKLFLPPKAAASSSSALTNELPRQRHGSGKNAANSKSTGGASLSLAPPPGFAAQPTKSTKPSNVSKNLTSPPGFSSRPPANSKGAKNAGEDGGGEKEEPDGAAENGNEQTTWTGSILSGLLGALKK